MAEIVLGIGTSHGPMLVTPSESWGARLPFDKEVLHHYQGKVWSFDELVAERKSEKLAEKITPEVWADKQAACKKAINKLADIFAEASPDIAVIIGNDQMEVFNDDMMPALAIMAGNSITNRPMDKERWARVPETVRNSMSGYITPEATQYASVPDLGKHLIRSAVEDGFDVTSLSHLPGDETPHAFGFVFRQIMKDKVIPTVPAFINTFYPPNQPSARRCYDFGKSLRLAIESWDSDARVALFASGGLSHFVIDEALDHTFLDCLRKKDLKDLTQMGEQIYQDGTSEIKNWIPVAGAMADLNFKMDLIDYIPCYRSEAGTGNAMGFVSWQAD
jgi:hypothetical protein